MSLNVLIVDDSATIRAVIEKTLGMAQVPITELHHAENGKEALRILEDHWIDLVFSDINMPVMNGIEMVEKMRENGLMKNTPVIVISTEGSATRIEQLKELGVTAYLRKPFAPEQFQAVVQEVVGA